MFWRTCTLAMISYLAVAGATWAASAPQDLLPLIGDEAMAKIFASAPQQPSAAPVKPRKVLIFTESSRDLETARKNAGQKFVPHASAPHAAFAVSALGEKTGAFASVITADPAVFAPERLADFDVIVLANVYLEKKLFQVPTDMKPDGKAAYEPRQKALLDFVSSGRGLVALHNAACTALGWPDYQKMVGATHHGHAWWSHQTVTIKVDDPQHPVSAAFRGQPLTISDDIYMFTAPYSRDSLRVLLSVDVEKSPPSMTAERADADYAVSWVKAWGKGRVFYTALGHEPATFQNAAFLRHLLDGIQFAAGDLAGDVSPGKPLPEKQGFTTMAGWTPLFDGKDLEAWRVSDAQKQHWVVEDGIIRYTGRAPTLTTRDSFRDYMLRVDWRLPRTSDSGVFVRGSKQLNIWCWDFGSGEMWEHRGAARTPEERAQYTPKSREDRAVGEWNTFLVTVQNDRVTVVLNGKEVISGAVLKDSLKQSPIGLQQHGDPVEFKSIYIKPLAAEGQ